MDRLLRLGTRYFAFAFVGLALTAIPGYGGDSGQSNPGQANKKNMNETAKRVLENRKVQAELDREYNEALFELAKTAVLTGGTRKKESTINEKIEVMVRLDQACTTYDNIRNKDVGGALRTVGEETIDFLIKTLEVTQPLAANALKAAVGVTQGLIVATKILQIKLEASQVSRNIAVDLAALDAQIKRDPGLRKSVAKQVKQQRKETVKAATPVNSLPLEADPRILADTLEIGDWLDGGDRQAFGSNQAKRNAFYERYPKLAQFAEVAGYRSPSSEFEDAGGYSLIAGGLSFDPNQALADEQNRLLLQRARERADASRSERTKLNDRSTEVDKQLMMTAALSEALGRDQYERFRQEIPDVSRLLEDGMYYSTDGGESWRFKSQSGLSSLLSDRGFWTLLGRIGAMFDRPVGRVSERATAPPEIGSSGVCGQGWVENPAWRRADAAWRAHFAAGNYAAAQASIRNPDGSYIALCLPEPRRR